jgi:uncharacterized protein (TIGR04255 family)
MVTFERPPLKEVVLGQTFVGRPDLFIPHIGVFCGRIRDKYPKAQHAQLILGDGETPVQDSNGNWLPRVWLISEDETWLVQIQQDRLYVNWRQTDQNNDYVRYPAVKTEFDYVWGVLDEVVTELTGVALHPQRLELAYTNIIPAGDAWKTVPELRNVLRDFHWHADGRSLSEPRGWGTRLDFDLGNANIVGADSNLSHRADPIMSQGWKPTLRASAVDKCRC